MHSSHRHFVVITGLTLGFFPIGPLIGFSMAAVFTRIPEDLKGIFMGSGKCFNAERGMRDNFKRYHLIFPDTKGMDPQDPRFIGAWWLGFVIIGALMLLFCIPMCFLAKHHAVYELNKNKSHKKRNKIIGTAFRINLKGNM